MNVWDRLVINVGKAAKGNQDIISSLESVNFADADVIYYFGEYSFSAYFIR